MRIILKAASIFAIICFCFSAIFSGIVGSESSPIKTTRSELTLKVALKADIKTRNILGSGDVWTSKVLWRCYDTTLKEDPETDEVIPFIAQCSGDEPNKLFGCDEWPKGSGIFDPHNVTVTYDFTNVKFHDGVQVTVDDLLASYYIVALHPRWYTDLTCLMDANGDPNISNFTTTHWLWIERIWESEDKLHAKLNFKLQEDFAMFYRSTLSGVLFPKHIWEGTGGDIHEDFGKLLDPKGHGVPAADGGFDINKALAWDITDDSLVIGNGPFKFGEWETGKYIHLTRFEEYFYKKPNIDGILFKIYEKTDDAVAAIKRGDIDYIAWSIPPDYLSTLTLDENIGISPVDELGFTYLAFNMQKAPCSYLAFRQAVAHCIDKETIVNVLLQGFARVGDSVVSPANTFWYNDSVKRYELNTTKAKEILDAQGWNDTDGDGWRELPEVGDNPISILTPPADYDPIRSAAGLMISTQMQKVGINVRSNSVSFGEIVRRIDAEDYDMIILSWAIYSKDPDYLYSFFYTDSGNNYPRYSSQTFDEKILASRKELNITKRQQLIKECQGILAEDLPYIVLYYRTNIEVYRCDRFVGWIVQCGTIFNYWSLIYIHEPTADRLYISISLPSAVASEGAAKVIITVRDQNKDIVENAQVYLSTNEGTIIPNNGTTNVNGQFIAVFHAPHVPSYSEGGSNKSIFIKVINATKEGYRDALSRTALIVVKPIQSKFLAVKISAEFDVVPSEGITYIDVLVTDENNLEVDGVQVNISVEPNNAYISVSNGTTVDGNIRTNITAPKVDEDTTFLIIARAKKSGYEDGEQSITIDVVGSMIVDKPPITSPDIFLILIVICIVSLIYGFVKKRCVE